MVMSPSLASSSDEDPLGIRDTTSTVPSNIVTLAAVQLSIWRSSFFAGEASTVKLEEFGL